MQAIILAGGNSARLHGWATDVPKPLAPFFDRPLIHYTVKLLARHGIRDIIVALSHEAKELVGYLGDGSNYGVDIRYSIEIEPMGSAGAVKVLQGRLSETFLVVSGDLITDLDLTEAIRMHEAAQSMASMVLHEVDDPSSFGIVGCDDSGRVTHLIEKPRSVETFTNTINTGIYVLEPEVLSSIPYNTAKDFATNLFPRLLGNQERVYGFEVPGYWCDTGDLLQYRNAHFDALQGKLEIDLPAVHVGEGIWVGGGVDIHPTARLSSPIYIGAGVSIGPNATIGDHTIIGTNSIIDEDAHVARSVIGAMAYVGKETDVADSVIKGGYLVTESGSTGEPAPAAPKAVQIAPANPIKESVSALKTLA